MNLIQRLIFIFLLVWQTNNIIAQELISFYEKYLPEDALQKKSYRKDINERLKLYVEYDPDLIYYYITYLNLKFQQKITNPDSNLARVTQVLFSEIKGLKRHWAQEQLKEVELYKRLSLKDRKVASYFKKYVSISYYTKPPSNVNSSAKKITNTIIAIDKNKLHFFTYIYLSKKEKLEYNPSTNYLKLFRSEAKKRIIKLTTYYQKMGDISKAEKKAILNEAFQYSYLFKDTYLEKYVQTTDFTCLEFVEKMFENDYLNYHRIFGYLSVSAFPIKASETITFDDPFISNYKKDVNFETSSRLAIWGGLSIKTREEYQTFSSINLRTGISISPSLKENLGNTVIFDGIRALYGVRFEGKYFYGEVREINISILHSQLTTPIFYFNKNLLIEAGIHYTFQSANFKYDMIRDGEWRIPHPELMPEFPEIVVEVDMKRHIASLVMSAILITPWHFNLRGDLFWPELIRLGSEFSFNL